MDKTHCYALRGPDGRGHFRLLIFFRRRARYKSIQKYPNFKGKMYGRFLYQTIIYS